MQTKQPEKSLPTRILGIDFGLKRIGLALSDERKIIAMPLEKFLTESNSEKTIRKFVEFLNKLQETYRCVIEEIVVGLPLMLNGKKGFLADEVNHFVGQLREAQPIPIRTWDERLSTVQAERSLREGSLTRKRRTQVVDVVSATIILQSYLDSKGNTFDPIPPSGNL